MSYDDATRKMHAAVLAALQEISGEELETAIYDHPAGQQTANPRQVLAELVWEKLDFPLELGIIKGEFVKVEGTYASQAHTWFERKVKNLEIDPLPRRTIIDVAPVGIVPSPIIHLPESPVLMLYRRKP